jgi:hypothetical protein
MTRWPHASGLTAVAWSLLACATADAQAFGPGEQCTYRINYLGLRGGTAQITVGLRTPQWGQQVWPIVIIAKTDPGVPFYSLRDKFVTYWDPVRERTVGSELLADENHHRHRQRIRIDAQDKTATVTRQKEGEAESITHLDVPPDALDIAATLYAVRDLPLAVDQQIDYPVFTGYRTFTLRAKVEARGSITLASGETREAFRIRVHTAFAGSWASNGDLVAYVSADPTHVPLRVEADFVIGTLAAELTDYKPGMAHPGG